MAPNFIAAFPISLHMAHYIDIVAPGPLHYYRLVLSTMMYGGSSAYSPLLSNIFAQEFISDFSSGLMQYASFDPPHLVNALDILT